MQPLALPLLGIETASVRIVVDKEAKAVQAIALIFARVKNVAMPRLIHVGTGHQGGVWMGGKASEKLAIVRDRRLGSRRCPTLTPNGMGQHDQDGRQI
jgi:hypothetical protein